MSEKIKNLSPTERLRQYLLDNATSSRNKKDWTPEGTAHAIANGMPWIYGFIKGSLTDETTRVIIENYATDQGFSSLIELKTSLDELRDALKSQLSEKDWQIYFKDTEDIQL
ncbi:hypothetical protein MUP56_00650 [Patescibacteria group bacterium]|nr:hypothetical protein [Patescibacteria group bacterium]